MKQDRFIKITEKIYKVAIALTAPFFVGLLFLLMFGLFIAVGGALL